MDVFCVTMWSVCSFLEIGRNFFTVGLLLTLPLFSIHTLRVTGSKDLHPVTISCYPYSSSDYLFLALFFFPWIYMNIFIPWTLESFHHLYSEWKMGSSIWKSICLYVHSQLFDGYWFAYEFKWCLHIHISNWCF